jgi:flagellar hook-associated protein 2
MSVTSVTPESDPESAESPSAASNGDGLVLTMKELAPSPITITVSDDPTSAVAAVRAMVDQYNRLVDKLDSLTFYNAETQEAGLLFGSNEALRIRSGFSRLFSGRLQRAGNIGSAGQMGIRLRETGKLEFDESKFTSALAENRTAVEQFFAIDEIGFADRLNEVAERIAGVGQGMLLSRSQTLATQVETNNSRVDVLNRRLGQERDRLLRRFQETEAAIAKIQSSQAALEQIRLISIPVENS